MSALAHALGENCVAVTARPEPNARTEDYRQKLRSAVLEASRLLTANALGNSVPAILQKVGEVLQADRVLVIEKHAETAAISLCYCWQRQDVRQITASLFGEYPSNSAEIRQWLRPLQEGRHVAASRRTASGAVGDLFRKLDMQSILIVPILLGDAIWGSVGVDSCAEEREWAPVEIDLLKLLANSIGATIVRDRYVNLLRASERKFRTVSEAALDAIIVIDGAGAVQYWNPAAERIFGYSADEAAGKVIPDWITPQRYRERAVRVIRRLGADGEVCRLPKILECAALGKDGAEIPVELSLAPMRVEGTWSAIAIVRDIRGRKEAEQRIVWLAGHDPLTGLRNRSVFVTEIEQSISHYRRSGERFAVFFLDLDHFKEVNDVFGHHAGDTLLKQVAERLRSTVRDTDRVARFGGDEFAVLATQLNHPTDAGILANKLVTELDKPFSIGGTEIQSGVSIGIAICDDDQVTADTLLAHADAALYLAKAEQGSTFHFFTHRLQHDVRQRLDLLGELRKAVDRDQLKLVYQPQVNLATRAVIGIEALVRWQHPQRGLLAPATFMLLAEENGVAVPLGRFVLREACRQAKSWLTMGLHLPLIAVNASPMQFKAPTKLCGEVHAALAESGLDPAVLEVELTENSLMQISQENSKCVTAIREQGVRIAIDNFGTGYSCLDQLRRFPASRLKIAQTFVRDMASNRSSAAAARAAINIGRELGISVIGEGIETFQQASMLTRWGCEEGQGYYFAKPLPADEVTELLRVGRVKGERELIAFRELV